MKCLVTGVAGFVGSTLAEKLIESGHDVIGVDCFIDYYPRYIKEQNLQTLYQAPNFQFIEADLNDLNLLDILKDVDWVFHQAAQAGVRASWGKDFEIYTSCNILATQRLLEAAKQTPSIKRVVYASSSSIYGDQKILPFKEVTTPAPVSPYGVSKLAAEHLCSLYFSQFGVPTVSLRYFTVYGPRQRPDMAFHKFGKSLIEGRDLIVYDDGYQTRDFTYIDDIVAANIAAATSPHIEGEIFNIAGGSRSSIREVIAVMERILGTETSVVYKPRAYGDVRNTFADITNASKLLNYNPVVKLEEGLGRELVFLKKLYQPAFVK